jgi:curved DNA-binding protein CbpA
MDNYKLFNLKKNNFTWDELKTNYKKLAIKNHPDKGGDENLFNHITEKFKQLAFELKEKDNNKSHFDLKKEYENNSQLKFDIDKNINIKFNKIFDENKYIDEDIEFGYGDTMIKSTKEREEFNINNIFGKINVSNIIFNNTFENKIQTTNIIKYKEPEGLASCMNIIHSEIGAKTTDYSGKTSNNSLQYSDLNIAYNEERIPNIDKNKKIFKNIKDYQKYSDEYLKNSFTEKEIKRRLKNKEIEEQEEINRSERVLKKDKLIQQHYNKMTNLLYN